MSAGHTYHGQNRIPPVESFLSDGQYHRKHGRHHALDKRDATCIIKPFFQTHILVGRSR